MGYILDLRKRVGHAPLIMTSACVLIVDEQDRVLLQKRADNGYWGYPGGSMEPGETFEDCARREALEETGLRCGALSAFAHMSGPEMHYIYPNGDEVYIAEIVFLCREYGGSLKAQESEVLEQRFFAVDALPEPIFPINRSVIGRLAEAVRAGTLPRRTP